MIPNYVSHKNNLLKINIHESDGLSATVFKVDHQLGRISEENRFALCNASKLKVKVEILTTATVLEELTGDYIPIILARVFKDSNSRKPITCIYLFSIDRKFRSFVVLRKIIGHQDFLKVDGKDDDSSKSFIVTDGPVISSHCDNKLYLWLPSEDLSTNLLPICFCVEGYLRENVDLLGCQACSNVKILNKLILLDVYVTNGNYLIFAIFVLECKQNCKSCRKHKRQLMVLNYFEKTFSVLNQNLYMPSEYDDVITFIKYIGPKLNGNHMMFAGTSEGYVLQIENGCLKRCISVSDDRCSSMACAITSILIPIKTDITDILVFQDRSAYHLDNSFKVCKKWDSVYSIHEGTFTSSGAWEFFLSFGNDVSSASWLLTDLGNVCICSDQTHSTTDDPATETRSNTQVAVQALQTRLQREMILLSEERQKEKQTAHFLEKCIETQLCILDGGGQQLPCHQPDLVPLICSPRVHFVGQHHGTASQLLLAENVEVIKVWQRTYNGRWLIGVDFHNKAHRDINVWLQIASACDSGTQLTVTSSGTQFTVIPSSQAPVCKFHSSTVTDGEQGFQSGNSKWLQSSDSCADQFSAGSPHTISMVPAIDEVHTVTCVTSMPIFGFSGIVRASVLLNWGYVQDSKREVIHVALSEPKRERTNDVTGDVTHDGLNMDELKEVIQPRVHTQYCGEVNLKSADVVQGKYELKFATTPETDNIDIAEIKDLKHNTVAWRSIQTVTSLDCRSTPSILTNLERLLCDRCQFVYNHSYGCYVTQVPSLRHVQMCVGPGTSGTVRPLDVYASCDNDVFLLLHHLYSCLPDHMVLIPQQMTSATRIQSCLPSLQREHHFLSHGIRKLLKDVDAKRQAMSDECLMEVDGEEDVRKVGDKFKLRREKLISRSFERVDSDNIQSLCEKMQDLRKDTDSDVVRSGLL